MNESPAWQIKLSFLLLRLAARLPLGLLRAVGRGFGTLVWWGNAKRRHVTQVNLGIAFPDWTRAQVRACAKLHLQLMGVCLLDRVWLWFAPLPVVYGRIQSTGFEHLSTHSERAQPKLLLVPHMVGLEAAGPAWVAACLALSLPAPRFCTVFQAPSSPTQEAIFRVGRGRYTDTTQYTRAQGIRPIVKGMREGRAFYCLPDNDFGAKDALFIPWFGLPAATVTVIPRLSRLVNAQVYALRVQLSPTGYTVSASPAWAADILADDTLGCAHMNTLIEGWARATPAEYMFSHRRYKTRPEGAPSVYD